MSDTDVLLPDPETDAVAQATVAALTLIFVEDDQEAAVKILNEAKEEHSEALNDFLFGMVIASIPVYATQLGLPINSVLKQLGENVAALSVGIEPENLSEDRAGHSLKEVLLDRMVDILERMRQIESKVEPSPFEVIEYKELGARYAILQTEVVSLQMKEKDNGGS